MNSVFNHSNYKEFLLEQVNARATKKGFQTQLAAAAGCQRAYISQVLRSHQHLTPDHACGIAKFLGLDERETDYFIALVDLARAGSALLRKRLEDKLGIMLEEQRNLSKRFQAPGIQDIEDQALYYSSWKWAAVHMILDIPQFRAAETIARRLGLAEEEVIRILKSLEQMGLAQQSPKGWVQTQQFVHLPKTSPLNAVNHHNWRTRCAMDTQNLLSQGMHYSATFTLSQIDLEKLKSMLVSFLQQQREVISSSPSEEIAAFTCDLWIL